MTPLWAGPDMRRFLGSPKMPTRDSSAAGGMHESLSLPTYVPAGCCSPADSQTADGVHLQGTTHLNLNSGFFYIQANERTISLMERIAARLAKEKAWDQVRHLSRFLPIPVHRGQSLQLRRVALEPVRRLQIFAVNERTPACSEEQGAGGRLRVCTVTSSCASVGFPRSLSSSFNASVVGVQ